jgi:hypothetical protein
MVLQQLAATTQQERQPGSMTVTPHPPTHPPTRAVELCSLCVRVRVNQGERVAKVRPVRVARVRAAGAAAGAGPVRAHNNALCSESRTPDSAPMRGREPYTALTCSRTGSQRTGPCRRPGSARPRRHSPPGAWIRRQSTAPRSEGSRRSPERCGRLPQQGSRQQAAAIMQARRREVMPLQLSSRTWVEDIRHHTHARGKW